MKTHLAKLFSSIFPVIILFFVFTSTVPMIFSLFNFLKPQPTCAVVVIHVTEACTI